MICYRSCINSVSRPSSSSWQHWVRVLAYFSSQSFRELIERWWLHLNNTGQACASLFGDCHTVSVVSFNFAFVSLAREVTRAEVIIFKGCWGVRHWIICSQTASGFTEDTPFNWTVEVESSIDSSYFFGYLITQVPGGFLASMYPANRIFGAAIFASALFNVAIPGAMTVGPTAVVFLKVAQGFVEVCVNYWYLER